MWAYDTDGEAIGSAELFRDMVLEAMEEGGVRTVDDMLQWVVERMDEFYPHIGSQVQSDEDLEDLGEGLAAAAVGLQEDGLVVSVRGCLRFTR